MTLIAGVGLTALVATGCGDDNAFTYDEVAVPVGSTVTVDSEADSGRTTITLEATGLAPNRDFGVHAQQRTSVDHRGLGVPRR
ncbi:hypothetical protein ACFTZB_44820 [Rhodococcus sp. NPDC057014]|uniref:hypothetical protein n=1 Tax=Rhodococcus sp. NPDC057014 TaxID=3346000 RepID=UPI0036450C25